jgi:hypothetical protein
VLIGSTFPDKWVKSNEEDLDVEVLPNDEFDDEDEPDDDQINVLDRQQVILNYLLHSNNNLLNPSASFCWLSVQAYK